MNLAELQRQLQEILDLGAAATDEQLAQGEALAEQIEVFQARATRTAALASRVQQATSFANTAVLPAPIGGSVALTENTGFTYQAPRVPSGLTPARARRRVQNFKDTRELSGAEQAYQFGRFVLASVANHAPSQRFCREHGIDLISDLDPTVNLASSEGVNTDGGFLVPEQFSQTLIDLREQFGVFAMYARREPMATDTKMIPRRTGGITAYFVDEGGTITDSTPTYDRVRLTAKKLAALTYISSEVDEDSVISMGDRAVEEIAYAFATTEDDCGFNGDGTSTYGGMVGVRTAFTNLSGTIANIAGLQVASGNAYSEITLNDFHFTKAKLPAYALARGGADVAWYCSKAFWESVMERLLLAAGGVTMAEVATGAVVPRFLGYPVRIAQKMPQVEGNSQVCCLFGWLAGGVAYGLRRADTIAASAHYRFNTDQLAIRGTTRFHVLCHDVGNASATAASRVAGPIVGLITAAS